jgi:hypothetical protein
MNTVGKAGKLGEQLKCVVSVSMLTEGWDCLDSETEILTPDGWVGRGEIAVGDAVYSLNRKTGLLEVVPVLEYGERPVRPNERMVRLKSQHLDIRVTEGHEFHIKYRDPRKGGALSRSFITKTGAELLARRSSYSLPLAAETAVPFPGVRLNAPVPFGDAGPPCHVSVEERTSLWSWSMILKAEHTADALPH